jgi:hypothetical protein
MSDRLTKCLACDGRGYFRCDCWPGDCICDEGDENCFECGGDGFTEDGEEQGCYWPDDD